MGVRQLSLPLAEAALLGLGHLAVEATTVVTAVALVAAAGYVTPAALAILAWHNGIAFATQPPLGWLVDRAAVGHRHAHRDCAVAGCVLSAVGALLLGPAPLAALVMSALGNALYHVGAGGLVLANSPDSAAAQGLFVAPGDLGVAVGMLVGGGRWPLCGHWFALASLATIVPLWSMPSASARTGQAATRRACWPLLLLLLAVIARPATVSWLGSQAPPGLTSVLTFYAVATAAKCLGGFVADRWGWRRACLAAALACAALLPVGGPLAPLTAAALAQLPTGVTLAAIGRRWPGWPGTAFGITSLALYLGGPPAVPRLPSVGWVVAVQVLCALCLAAALSPKADGAENAP